MTRNMGLSARLVRKLLNRLIPYLDFICFYVLFPGGPIYAVAQYLYILCFDWVMRQKTSWRHSGKIPAADWEDPAIVGRNRRRVRSTCTSFRSKEVFLAALQTKSASKPTNREVLVLTGEPGTPDEVSKWDFLLVGCPTECPQGWNDEDYEVLRNRNAWTTVALPNHWQLQGFDVPIYTNTTYPFAFDPPRARRNGHWVDAACDQGLGAATSAVFPSPLHPQEPGENATGLYRRKFALSDLVKDSEDLSKSRLFLVFAGVDSCLTVWLDGQYVGYSQDSCLPAEFDITQICRAKRDTSAEHTLAVQVSRWCDGSYLEDQDKWWLSGIYREVYIERRPAVFLSDFEFSSTVRTRETVPRPMESGYITPGRSVLSADIIVSVLGEGVRTTSAGSASPFTAPARAHAVRVEFWSSVADKKPIAVFTKEFVSGHDLPNRIAADSIYADRKGGFGEKTSPVTAPGVATVKGTLTEPVLWTAETPFLYTLVVSLHASLADATADVNSLHAQSHKVGVRKVSIGGPDNVLRINDCPITIAGINRHEFSPKTGRAVTKTSMREDAILLKKLNFNAVRSAHYPQHPYWLEVCDEVGLYVIDEANIETHGFQVLGQPVGYLSSRPEWELALTSRVTRMYERDKNHACVIGWSLGNESGHGKTHDNMAHWLRLRDPHRFVQYESGGARTGATDIICPMYLRPQWCEEQALRDTKRRPVILCEYAHAMGNSGGCLATYWQLFRDPKYPRVQGGFIWDFVDQGLLLPGGVGFGYGGDFGDLPNTKQFCCNGIASPARGLFPGAFEAAHLQSPVEVTLLFDSDHNPTLIVSNRRSFADLSDLRVVVRPCFHSGEVDRHMLGNTFEFRCGPIVAGSFRKFELVDQIKSCMNFTAAIFEPEHNLLSRNSFGHSEAWLDVAVMTRPDFYAWHPESFEVMHTAFASPMLKVLFHQLSRGGSVFPLPPLHTARSGGVFSDSRTNTSTSCTSSAASSPFPHLLRGDNAFSTEDIAESGAQHLPMTVQVVEQVDLSRGLFVRWNDGSVANIGRACGRLLSWKDRHGRDLLAAPVEPCFFRAGTDNDRGGMAMSYYTRWKEVGLDRLVRRAQKTAIVSQRWLGNGSAEIATSWVLESPRDAAIAVSFQCEMKYIFDPHGAVDVHFSAVASAEVPPLARCGLRWAMPEQYAQVKYFGLGPHEAYDDRLASVYLGVFETTVQAMHTNYTFPQECGRRADPRWVLFGTEETDGTGLVVMPIVHGHHGPGSGAHSILDAMSSDNSSAHASITQAASAVHGWGFSASPYSLEALDATAHDHELRPDADGRTHVHFDSHTMGLGGYDSWSPNVDEVFLVHPHLPPPSLRQTTMPASIAPKTNGPPRALATSVRMLPWTRA